MSIRNKILVTGSPDIGTVGVVQGILTSSGQPLPSTTQSEILTEKSQTTAGRIIPWKIDTKYYTASVDFWLDEPPLDSLTETITAYSEPVNGVEGVVDAFIFVFKQDQKDSFEILRRWLQFLDTSDPSIRICVGLSPSSNTVPAKAENDEGNSATTNAYFEDFCLENQFVYVDMDYHSDIPMDKTGYDLIVDTLHTNMWDGMSRKDGQRQASRGPDIFKSALDVRDEGEDDHNADGTPDDDELLEDMDDDEFIKEMERLSLKYEINANDDLPTKEEVDRMHEQLFKDIDQEDGIDKTMQSLLAMRERGKDLPDDERRRMAAQVALSFAAQLGL